MFAVLGTVTRLCELDKEAQALIADSNISIGFAVKNGPSGTLRFNNGKASIERGASDCTIRLPFGSCERFNGMVDGTVTPFPSKGFTKIGFLMKRFTKLTDILTKYLRPEPEALDDEDFFRISTTLMFHVIIEAIAQIGNEDAVGRQSASYIDDGIAKLSIGSDVSAGLKAENHRLTAIHEEPDSFTSYMTFADMKLARQLFDGKVNAVACVGTGLLRIGGLVPQVDNISRILDRVALYLA
jgi:hypothetical protein